MYVKSTRVVLPSMDLTSARGCMFFHHDSCGTSYCPRDFT